MHYWLRAGLPSNVMNLLIGGAEVAKALVNNPAIKGILFTGSYATGKQIHQALAGQPERLAALEMGGNNPLIVDEVDDIDAAILMTILSAYLTSGQRCTCSRRLLVESRSSTPYLNRLASALEKIAIDAYDATPQPFMSSIIRPNFAEKLLITQQDLIDRDAQVIIKMNLTRPGTGMLSPGILDVTEVKKREDKEVLAHCYN